ncbi:cytochrome c biogenesis protein ResB [Pseudalkalibacillus berkeleyi]|uniref:Cytochrome c biogenesis protein ResB n=1 Tax=Pseudalkalibacillus berkeleyi TaxID=1069813 RepID=A0ABS9GXX9_9BACL|nr:cytochrome c biogenesis protein ResB [Pseudalkalibacillus berkeleyi]MCF6137622.1 cytochrome c biogenesis protein ResB [Pseudalkalibacillus berkeleyi]
MEKIKCECGHLNPYGTVLCESCGNPIQEDSSKKQLVNMRYEGTARRSQTYNANVIDKIWNFFSSVKVGVWLIVITLIASAVGTIFPQKMYIPTQAQTNPAAYYEEEYGILGEIYYVLGFHNLYSSWWFVLLLGLIGVSITVASIDRGIPLYRTLKNQRVTKHDNFLKKQRLFTTTKRPEDVDQFIEEVIFRLKEKRYRVRREKGNILAEKGRFSRWGPYVNHVGLIIFLIGSMLRVVPGLYLDTDMWVREGETKAIKGTDQQYYLKHEKFTYEEYDPNEERFSDAINRVGGSVVKNYQSDVVLYKAEEKLPGAKPELTKVKEYPIQVNKPLQFDGYSVYQVDYRNEMSEMSFEFQNKETEKSIGKFSVDLNDPKNEYDLGNGNKVVLNNYYPDFYFDSETNKPSTKTNVPNNPAFIFKMITPETPEGEIAFIGIRQNLEPSGENQYKIAFDGIDTDFITGLTVSRDYTLPIIFIGGIIFMIGVIQGLYWNHRRVWFKLNKDELWIAAHTNKNWHGIKRELQDITDKLHVNPLVDQQEEKK